MLKVNPKAGVDQAPGFRRMFHAGRLTLGVFFCRTRHSPEAGLTGEHR